VGRLVLACALAGCGRIGFGGGGPPGTGTTGALADGAMGAATGDGAATAITYVKALVGHEGTMGASESFALQAVNAGDAVAFMVGCAGAGTPTGVTLVAPGWTLAPLSPMTAYSPGQIANASFGAIAPDTLPTTATVTWAGVNCNRGKTELADEFAGNDPTNAFDAHAEAPGAGTATTTITTGHANDAVWGGVYSATMATAIGSGDQAGATDGNGDFAEYALTFDPASTVETVAFANANGFVVVAATIAPPP
jgi:hypothetical protein